MSRSDDNIQVRELLDRAFVEADDADSSRELDPGEARQLFAALREDGEARGHFDRLAYADRAVRGDLHRPSRFERDLGEAAFLGALDEMLAEEEAPDSAAKSEDDGSDSSPARVIPIWSRRSARVIALAATVALAVGAVAWLQSGRLDGGSHTANGEFQPRSAVVDRPAHDYEQPRVEVFCVERTDDGVAFRGKNDSDFEVVTCSQDDEIKLAVANSDARLKYVSFFGASEDGTIHWYGPSPVKRSAFGLETSQELRPIGETIRLRVNHEPGAIRVYALCTEEPVGFSELRDLVEPRKHGLFAEENVLDGVRGVAASVVFDVVKRNP